MASITQKAWGNTHIELRRHLLSCISCEHSDQGWELAGRGSRIAEHFQPPKHPAVISIRNMFIYSYLMEKNRRFWHAAWGNLTGRMSRKRKDGDLCVTDLGNTGQIPRISTTVNLWCSLVTGLFESPNPQAMAGSFSYVMHVRCSLLAGKIKFTYQYGFDCIVLKAPSKQMG